MNEGNYYADDKVLSMYLNKDGVFEEYDDTYDITIHCKSKKEQENAIKILTNFARIKRELNGISIEIESLETHGDSGMIGFKDQVLQIIHKHFDSYDKFFEELESIAEDKNEK